ncbi:hypothetical protein ECW26_05750 [Escherichia coli W26]|nr:hypothetical protein ECW26_05750 [Escherichia coli W26]
MIVKMDTVFHRLLDSMPVGLFETLLRPGSHFEESTILSVEALQNGLSNQ